MVQNPFISHGNLTDYGQVIKGQCWLITNQISLVFWWGWVGIGGAPLDYHDMI